MSERRPHNFIDITKRRFSSLVVVEYAGNRLWLCRCDCGGETTADGKDLRSGHTTSCGCAMRRIVGDMRRIHGMKRSSEYRIWRGMVQRCRNQNNRAYHRYGGRGIRVCERWERDFTLFYEDMGPRPSVIHSVDRIDNDGNYEPDNCRWATPKQQANNKSKKVANG